MTFLFSNIVPNEFNLMEKCADLLTQHFFYGVLINGLKQAYVRE